MVSNASCLSELYSRLDAVAFEAALSRWIKARCPADANKDKEPFSIDGKTVRGSRDGEVPGQHLVAAYAPLIEAVLVQVRVDAKTNEHKAALQLLGILPVKNRIIIGDAMFCQRDIAAAIIDQGGDYIFFTKANQPGLQIDVAAGFGFEAAAQSVAAAFSPGWPSSPAAARTDGPQRGQGTRSVGREDVADNLDADTTPEMAGVGSGL